MIVSQRIHLNVYNNGWNDLYIDGTHQKDLCVSASQVSGKNGLFNIYNICINIYRKGVNETNNCVLIIFLLWCITSKLHSLPGVMSATNFCIVFWRVLSECEHAQETAVQCCTTDVCISAN